MTQKINLKEIERKTFRSTFQDGLWDIFLGCIILQFAIGPSLNDLGLGDFWSSVVFVPFYLLAYLGLWAGKKFIITPRIGMVKYGPARQVKLKKLTAVSFFILFTGVVIGLLAFINGNPASWIYPTFVGAMMFVGLSLAAYFLDFTRLYFYGVLVALAFPVGEWLFRYAHASHHGFPIVFGTTTGVMMLTGLVLFIRFLRDYPLPAEGDFNGNPV